MRFKRLASVLLFAAMFMLPLSVMASAATDTLILKTYFREGSTSIERSYRNNAYELDSFKSKIRDLKANSNVRIVSSTIDGSGSPTGSSVANKELASYRAIALYRATRSWLDGIGVRTKVNDGDIGWNSLAEMVKVSDVPYKNEVLDIIYNTPIWIKEKGVVVGSRKLSLINLRDGVPYRYMEENLFDACRWATLTIVYESNGEDSTSSKDSGTVAGTGVAAGTAGAGGTTGTGEGTGAGDKTSRKGVAGQGSDTNVGTDGKTSGKEGSDDTGKNEPEKQAKKKKNEPEGQSSANDTTATSDSRKIAGLPEPMGDDDVDNGKGKSGKDGEYKAAPRPMNNDGKRDRKPAYVCFKNNLLGDIALLPNLALEFHLGHNWTMGVAGYYSWWRDDKYHYCEEILGLELNIRKYLGRRAKEKPLTGHHLGIYGQVVNYDVNWKFSNVGYQGAQWVERFPGNWGVGIEYGYSVPVGRRLNMDFTIGGGYFETLCSTYNLNMTNHPGRQELVETKSIKWWGPTKAEISLVWLIGYGNYNTTKRSRK